MPSGFDSFCTEKNFHHNFFFFKRENENLIDAKKRGKRQVKWKYERNIMIIVIVWQKSNNLVRNWASVVEPLKLFFFPNEEFFRFSLVSLCFCYM
jgi:hypothetical protein